MGDIAQGIEKSIQKKGLEGEIINIGSGSDIEIKQLAEKIRKIIRYKGNFKFDISKPDGTPKKLLDISKINELGWKPKISLDEGIEKTYLEKFL